MKPSFIILVTKGIIRDQRMRRIAMFYSVLAALLALFCGSTFLEAWLRERPLLFLGYWAGCALLTLNAVLLALFDMLMIRAAHRLERRRLAKTVLGKGPLESDPGHEDPR